ncbi:MAG: glycosyltransferase [Verrucomicrobiales bacterium]
MPKVSIITRTKDRPALLERTLCSIREQTYTDWEWVLVDAGDQPPSSVVSEFLDGEPKRTRRIEVSGNPLMGAMSNIGVRAGNSDYVVLLDDDDTWDPEFLNQTVRRLDERFDPVIGGVATHTNRVYEHANGNGQWIAEMEKKLNPDLEYLDIISLASRNRFTVNAFLYLRTVFEKIGGYREDLPVLDDWDFNLRFILHNDIDVLPKPLANWHIREKETTGTDANSLVAGKAKHLYYRAAIINKYLREEIENGKPGMGKLIGNASAINVLLSQIESLQRKLISISRKVGRIDTRTKTLKDMKVRKSKRR